MGIQIKSRYTFTGQIPRAYLKFKTYRKKKCWPVYQMLSLWKFIFKVPQTFLHARDAIEVKVYVTLNEYR